MKNQGECKYCGKIRHLCGSSGFNSYCVTCYRKHIAKHIKCTRCKKTKYTVTVGLKQYCLSCYNYLKGYYSCGNKKSKISVKIKRQIKPRKCFFCKEDRIEMLDIHHKIKESQNPKDLTLLCPNCHREVHLGYKKLPVDN